MIRWFASGIAAGAAVGWIAARIHLSGWAPVGLLSMGVGGVLGFTVARLAAATGVTCWRRLLLGTAIFALVAVFVEHAWLYGDFRRQWIEARDREPQVALFRPAAPWSPAEYVRHEWSPERIALWGLDAALVVGGAVGVAVLQRRRFVVADDANNS